MENVRRFNTPETPAQIIDWCSREKFLGWSIDGSTVSTPWLGPVAKSNCVNCLLSRHDKLAVIKFLGLKLVVYSLNLRMAF